MKKIDRRAPPGAVSPLALLVLLGGESSVMAQCANTWSSPLSGGTNNVVWALATMPNGDVVAGGRITSAGGTGANYIARWDGAAWTALGSGMNAEVVALVAWANDLYAGGFFTTAGGSSVNYIARWDGTSWSALGAGMAYYCAALAVHQGSVVAGGAQTPTGLQVAKWNGTTLNPIGSGLNGDVGALTTLANGDLVASGGFSNFNYIARWDGTAWTGLGSGLNGSAAALATHGNNLYAGGGFTTAGGSGANFIARWDGSSWSALGGGLNGPVCAINVLPSGDLLVGGFFTTAGGSAASQIARWNGTAWSALGTGMDNAVRAFTTLANGDRIAGGDFTITNGVTSNYLSRLTTTCPATVTRYGGQCSSSAGPLVLTHNSPPYIGSTYLSTATSMPTLCFALGVFGFSQVSIDLSTLFAAGVSGCNLLANPDFVDGPFWFPFGQFVHQLAIPFSTTLIGLALNEQVLSFEVDPSLNIVAVVGTNGLALTIGHF